MVSLDDIVPPDESDDGSNGQLGQEFYDRLSVALGERIKACGPRVPVVTGMVLCSDSIAFHLHLTAHNRHRILWTCAWLASPADRERVHRFDSCAAIRWP